ncbi:MAG: methyltransferase domain-containing protein [Verrucomicrobia bacterium]|nr:methyltransferase domain-containing protein [Verrucomicrobiota bacterium]
MLPDATQHYRGDAGRHYHASKRALPAAAVPWVARRRAEKLQPYVNDGDVVFEYGVGLGWNLAQLRCRRKMGCDVGEFLADSLRDTDIEFVSDPRSLPDELADVVVCHHTLEHLLAPAEALTEMRRLLREAGRLVVFVPYEKERRYRRWRPDEPNHHLYSWNAQTLANLVAECGFTVESATIQEYGWERVAAVWACRFRLPELGFRIIRRAGSLVFPLREVRVIATKPADPPAARPGSGV